MNLNFLFPIVFFLLLYGFNFYVINNSLKLFEFKIKFKVWTITLGIFLLFILLMTLSWFLKIEFLGNSIFYFETIVFILFFIFLFLDLIGFIHEFKKKSKIIFIIFFIIIYFGYGIFNANQIHINEINIESDKINQPLKVVQISDIHTGSTSKKFLKEVVSKVNELSPDVVVITGDLVDSINTNSEDLESLKEFEMRAYFIFGNHEIYARKNKDFFEKLNLIVLDNSATNFGEIEFVGINLYDNESNHGQINDLGAILENISSNTSKYTILLNHEPLKSSIDISKDIDLILSGHTHAGQIFPFNLFVKLRYNYVYGLYEEKESLIYVTSGTGVWGPHIRVGSKNEIVVFNIT